MWKAKSLKISLLAVWVALFFVIITGCSTLQKDRSLLERHFHPISQGQRFGTAQIFRFRGQHNSPELDFDLAMKSPTQWKLVISGVFATTLAVITRSEDSVQAVFPQERKFLNVSVNQKIVIPKSGITVEPLLLSDLLTGQTQSKEFRCQGSAPERLCLSKRFKWLKMGWIQEEAILETVDFRLHFRQLSFELRKVEKSEVEFKVPKGYSSLSI